MVPSPGTAHVPGQSADCNIINMFMNVLLHMHMFTVQRHPERHSTCTALLWICSDADLDMPLYCQSAASKPARYAESCLAGDSPLQDIVESLMQPVAYVMQGRASMPLSMVCALARHKMSHASKMSRRFFPPTSKHSLIYTEKMCCLYLLCCHTIRNVASDTQTWLAVHWHAYVPVLCIDNREGPQKHTATLQMVHQRHIMTLRTCF